MTRLRFLWRLVSLFALLSHSALAGQGVRTAGLQIVVATEALKPEDEEINYAGSYGVTLIITSITPPI